MSGFQNKRKEKFLSSISTTGLESSSCDLTSRCKFNFSYFDCSQSAGQDYVDWGVDGLEDLLRKLTEYSKNPLLYWKEQKRLVVYDSFPLKSDFVHPKHVPHDVKWGRFRMESAVRLVGFVVPGHFQNKRHEKTGLAFDCNTFYVVFLDRYHKFYKTEAK